MIVILAFIGVMGHFVRADDFKAGPPISDEEKAEASKISLSNQTKPTFNTPHIQENKNDTSASSKGGALQGAVHRWPNRRIPFVIDQRFTRNERLIIARAIFDIELVSCVRWDVVREFDVEHVRIIKNEGPLSCLATHNGFVQDQLTKFYLSPECLSYSRVLHNMFHIMGFLHEHTRADRDKYVKVHWDRISKVSHRFIKAFFKVKFKNTNSTIKCDVDKSEEYDNCFTPIIGDFFGEPYDFFSIMHYGMSKLSQIPEDIVLEPLYPTDIGGAYMSSIDIRKLNKAYCSNSPLFCHEVQRLYKNNEVGTVDAIQTNCKRWNLMTVDSRPINILFTFFEFDKDDQLIIAEGNDVDYKVIYEFSDKNRPSIKHHYELNVSNVFVEMKVADLTASRSDFYFIWMALTSSTIPTETTVHGTITNPPSP